MACCNTIRWTPLRPILRCRPGAKQRLRDSLPDLLGVLAVVGTSKDVELELSSSSDTEIRRVNLHKW